MKSGTLGVHYLGLALADFGRNRAVARAGEPGDFFVFLSGKQCTIFTDFLSPNFTKFEHNTSIGVAMNPFGTEF